MMFIPVLPVYFYGVFHTRKLLYFTAVNPSIDMGGFFGEKKDDILQLIPQEYKVNGIHITDAKTKNEFLELLSANNLSFPLVLKPNVGERGDGVKIVRTIDAVVDYAQEEDDFLIQEYIDFPLELGVLYSKLPNERGGVVTSITEKKFLSVKGDGSSDVEKLLKAHPRNRLYFELVKADFPDRLRIIPKKGEEYIVHYIGNHVKGTQFLNGNNHISEQLHDTFSKLGKQVDGFFYGRYDLKVRNYKELAEGKDIKIFELNGVSAEPGHIYDMSNVFKAYRDLSIHWLMIIKISDQNIKKGVKTTPLSQFIKQVKAHFFNN